MMFPLTNNKKNSHKKILIIKENGNNMIVIDKIWFFSQEDFLFTLQKTFKSYNPIINQNNNEFTVIMDGKYAMGSILRDFYQSIANHWLYY